MVPIYSGDNILIVIMTSIGTNTVFTYQGVRQWPQRRMQDDTYCHSHHASKTSQVPKGKMGTREDLLAPAGLTSMQSQPVTQASLFYDILYEIRIGIFLSEMRNQSATIKSRNHLVLSTVSST